MELSHIQELNKSFAKREECYLKVSRSKDEYIKVFYYEGGI
jgi:hypothetical protein